MCLGTCSVNLKEEPYWCIFFLSHDQPLKTLLLSCRISPCFLFLMPVTPGLVTSGKSGHQFRDDCVTLPPSVPWFGSRGGEEVRRGVAHLRQKLPRVTRCCRRSSPKTAARGESIPTPPDGAIFGRRNEAEASPCRTVKNFKHERAQLVEEQPCPPPSWSLCCAPARLSWCSALCSR